ncbi:Predicted exporter protein, RND superfamily [Natronoarchaeum philippinense]|uniref:Predicted exporter protein, RND superfamily n=1 Tax=Natronoarchaeum philippinense TaxID=558529 RepID=A0A285NZV7_NATPI|nr:MMPL family transporter [Natronoarchaeum philippinense]SNZ15005.1 Predicted exporter protein, RND superfamily [Natronoarchaeum philippinense]
MSRIDRVTAAVTEHSRVLVLALLLVTAALAPGLVGIEQAGAVSGLSGDSEAAEANAEIRERFDERDVPSTTTVIAVRNEDDNVLSRDSLLRTLRYQQTLHDNRTVNATLVEDSPVVGIENIVARAAIQAERRGTVTQTDLQGWNESEGLTAANGSDDWPDPTIDDQIEQLESMNASEVSAVVGRILDPESSSEATRRAYQLLPESYRAGATTADARMMVLTQATDGQVSSAAGLSGDISEALGVARSLATDRADDERYYFYGAGLVNYEQDTVIQDSFGILGPLAVLFVLVALSLAYRDPVDVLLGVVGIAVALIWTMGAMGWLGIMFNPLMIAAPIILIGLSVDFALHVTMRYREVRHRSDAGVRSAMREALADLGPALALITATTVIGFLSNYTSPMADLRTFGLVTAIGITATLVVFGGLIPALKVEITPLLARRGWDRTPSLPGTGGRLRRLLDTGATIATRAPLVLLVVTGLFTGAAAYGATGLQMSAQQDLFMGDDPPEFTENLPDAIEPSDYSLKEDRQYIYSTFQSPDRQGYVFVTGDVTTPETLERVADAHHAAVESGTVYEAPRGGPAILSPLSEMRSVARENQSFNATFQAADSSGNGVPDRDLESLYDEFHAAAPDRAARTLDRADDGSYAAMQVRISTDGSVDRSEAVAAVSDAAAEVDDNDDLEAVATGSFVIEQQLNDRLSTTLIESLSLTIVAILLILMAVFRLTAGSFSLGAITLVPVILSVTWLFGTMATLGIPISLITAMVGSVTVGIGVDYAIHVSERYWQERADASPAEALVRTVTGSGSALLSSAVTTAIGFGVLSFALLPALRHFGFVLALGVVYSFLGALYVQPSLLMLWDRYVAGTHDATASSMPVGND